MKKLLPALVLLIMSWDAEAQPCQKVDLSNRMVTSYLREYVSESIRDGYMPKGMGIVKIRKATDLNGLQIWELNVVLDNAYQDDPPSEYAQLGETIIIFYDFDSANRKVPVSPTPELINCLDEIIGDRVYIRPPSKQRWAEYKVKGELIRETVGKTLSGGYPRSSILFTFQKDGAITTSRPFRE